ncbi:putative uncharacterized protein [Clostridium sp. CAG:433]|nr:putative uncharacterized protein [Clostridium sp. CAG:433]
MKKRIINIFTLIITLVLILLFLKLINYKCIYRELFNIYCAGCGFTRMIESIINLKFYQAFRYNPLFFILFIIFIPYFIYQVYLYIRYGNIKKPSLKLLIILVIILSIYMVLRNIPLFNYLIPTKIN